MRKILLAETNQTWLYHANVLSSVPVWAEQMLSVLLVAKEWFADYLASWLSSQYRHTHHYSNPHHSDLLMWRFDDKHTTLYLYSFKNHLIKKMTVNVQIWQHDA